MLDSCYRKEWTLYCKKPFHGAESVIQYLGKYTHRIAISNYRIKNMTKDMVTFTAKDYKNQGKWKEVTISGEEFIRRFLMHVPPKRFVRIRHYGLLSSRNKNKKLSLCRNLLGQQLLLLTRFVQPGKIETDANERAVIGKAETAFSFAPPSILSLTIYQKEQHIVKEPDAQTQSR